MILNVGRKVDRTRNTARRRRIIANGDTKYRKEDRQNKKHSSQELLEYVPHATGMKEDGQLGDSIINAQCSVRCKPEVRNSHLVEWISISVHNN